MKIIFQLQEHLQALDHQWQPGCIKAGNSSSTLNKITDYNSLVGKIEKFTQVLVKIAEDTSMAAEKVLTVVQADRPNFRKIGGYGPSALVQLQHLAQGVLEKNVLNQLNKNITF